MPSQLLRTLARQFELIRQMLIDSTRHRQADQNDPSAGRLDFSAVSINTDYRMATQLATAIPRPSTAPAKRVTTA